MGTPPVLNASIHAAIHALNLVLLFLLARSLVGAYATGRDRVMVVAFWLLGAVAPVYWHLVGTSFADLLTSVLVLAGLWLIVQRPTLWGIAAGAALAGAAVGLRVHNAIYIAGLLCALALARFPSQQVRLRSLAVFCSAAFCGWLLCFAPWGLRLYREFGSPLFPFYNGVFHSPDFPAANLPLYGFVPDNLLDLVTLPFRIATPDYWVYVETRLPDLRPALLVVCLLLWLLKRRTVTAGASVGHERQLILVFFAASALLWLATSSNGRYGVALFLLGGPVCAMLLSRALPFRYVLLIIAGVVGWQALLQGMLLRESRVVSTPWTSRYFDWNVPDRYRREPATFLAFGLGTGSTLAPRVHPASSHVSLVGQYVPNVDTPGSDRIRRIIALPQRIYGVFDSDYTLTGEPGSESMKTYFRGHLQLWGLDFTDASCDGVALRASPEKPAWIRRLSGFSVHAVPPSFIVCELRPIASDARERAVGEFKAFAAKLERFGAACPRYFGKPLSYTRLYRRWKVSSLASFEWSLEVPDEGAITLRQLKAPDPVQVGRVTPEGILTTESDCRKWLGK